MAHSGKRVARCDRASRGGAGAELLLLVLGGQCLGVFAFNALFGFEDEATLAV